VLPTIGSKRRAVGVGSGEPDAAVAGVAVEVNDDAFGGVLDRDDIGWTEK
jgi:hypothetical protein